MGEILNHFFVDLTVHEQQVNGHKDIIEALKHELTEAKAKHEDPIIFFVVKESLSFLIIVG